MQAASILLTPIVMTGADLLFSTFKEDSYTEEANRHNLKMEQLEKEQIEWSQNYALEEKKYNRKRELKSDAQGDIEKDRQFLKSLLDKKGQLKGQVAYEKTKHKKKNPYYFAVDLIATASFGFLVYKIVRSFSGKPEKLEKTLQTRPETQRAERAEAIGSST